MIRTAADPPVPGAARILFGLYGAVEAFYLFASGGRSSVLFWLDTAAWPITAALWLAGLLVAAAAFLAFRWLFDLAEACPPGERPPGGRHLLAVAVVIGAGTFLRFAFAREVPPGTWCDVLYEIEPILRQGPPSWIGGSVYAGASPGTNVMVSNLYLRFAHLVLSVSGRSQEGIAAVSALPSALALPAVYWLAREASGARVALVAVTLMAFARWPLVFSGWTWTGAMLLPLVLGAAAATLRALRTGRTGWAILAGAFLGLSLHCYVAAWSAAGGFALFGLLVLRSKGPRLPAVALAAALATLAPFAAAYLEHPDRIGGRARDVGIASRVQDASAPNVTGGLRVPARLAYNALEYSGALLFTSDPNPRHGLPGRAALSPLLGLAALAGLALSAGRAFRGSLPDLLLSSIALGALLAGVLSNPGGAPNTFRMIVLIGPVFIAAARTLLGVFDSLAPDRHAVRAFAWALAALALLATETVDALVTWPGTGIVRNAFCPDESLLGRLRDSLAPSPTVLAPGALAHPIVFETLSAPPDPGTAVPVLPTAGPKALLHAPLPEPFWYVASGPDLRLLRDSGWRVGRGIGVRAGNQGPLLWRVAAPRDAAAPP